MLTRGDDYPLHQTPEPVAYAGSDRNFYDRYFFNGYSAHGDIFFAAALGVYPALDIMDASFCVRIGTRQHNLRASRRLGGDRLDIAVGPIRIEIVEPLRKLRLVVAENDGPMSCDLMFDAVHAPIEEPRFTRRVGTRLVMDYTRLTQNGRWTGTITVDGRRIDVTPDAITGTRDRSWGIRPIGAPDPQAPPSGGQFWWLWMPMQVGGTPLFCHSNDDAAGQPWNRRAVLVGADGAETHHDAARIAVTYRPGTRRAASVTVDLGTGTRLVVTPRDQLFCMSGLGYLHPVWGHGMDHGTLDVAHDSIDTAALPAADLLTLHVQAMADAILVGADGTERRGVGVVEQLFIGPHRASGLVGTLDGAA